MVSVEMWPEDLAREERELQQKALQAVKFRVKQSLLYLTELIPPLLCGRNGTEWISVTLIAF